MKHERQGISLAFSCRGWFWICALKIEANEDIAIISRRRVMLELNISMEIQSIMLAARRYLRLLASTPDISV